LSSDIEKPVDFGISEELFEENKAQLCTTMQKTGGPYSKGQRRKRRQEVFRLHFEQGLPAVKIAEMMKVNRNTVNQDIKVLYEKMSQDIDGDGFNGYFTKQVVRLETQRSRLMAYLSETQDLDQKLGVERQIADLDFRLAGMVEKFKHSIFTFSDELVKRMNEAAEDHKLDVRFTSMYELYKIAVDSRKSLDRLKEKVDYEWEAKQPNEQGQS
jgi:predicted DNA-binding protein YlxM (UPF0122 family)